MQESFKEYRLRKKSPVETMETVFGSHSQDKLTEESEYTSPTDKDHDTLHNTHVPLDLKHLNVDHLASIRKYTQDSTMINGYLHNKHNKKNATEIYHDQVSNLSSALDKQKTKKPADVYTGVPYSPAKHFHQVDGKTPQHTIVHLPAFTSTSTSRRKAAEFARSTRHKNDKNHGIKEETRHVIKIHVPAGSSAASVRDESQMEHEQEVLLNRGHNIQIHHEPEDIGHNTMLWHAKVISHTPDKI